MVTNTQISETTLFDRLRGVLMLNRPAYEEIGDDPTILPLAVGIAVAASIANGIASMTGDGPGFVGGFLQMLVGFVLFSLAVWLFGIMFSSQPNDVDLQRVIRVTGVALMPMLLFAMPPLPVVGWLLNLAGSFWVFFTTVLGVSVAARVGIGKALMILVLAGIVAGLGILLVVLPIFG